MDAHLEGMCSQIVMIARVIEGAAHRPESWTYKNYTDMQNTLSGPCKVLVCGGPNITAYGTEGVGVAALFSADVYGGMTTLFLDDFPMFTVPTYGYFGLIEICIRAHSPSFAS